MNTNVNYWVLLPISNHKYNVFVLNGTIIPSSELLTHSLPNALFLYSLKTLENSKVFWCFQGVEKELIGNEWVKSFSIFNEKIRQFIGPSPNSVYNCHNCKRIKFFKRLRLVLGQLQEHKLKHSFHYPINPLRNCDRDVESATCLWIASPLIL